MEAFVSQWPQLFVFADQKAIAEPNQEDLHFVISVFGERFAPNQLKRLLVDL